MRGVVASAVCLLLSVAPSLAGAQEERPPVVVGSKSFSESRLLAEIMAQLIEAHTDMVVERKLGLSGTMMAFGGLTSGEIDVYPEYTGTGLVEILKHEQPIRDPLRIFLMVDARSRAAHDVAWLKPFGFNNTYALVVPEEKAEELGLETISDLAAHPELRLGLSHEFLDRNDGWKGLAPTYGLEELDVRGLEHGLAYEAIRSGAVDVIDAYSTDGKLPRFNLRVLEDDRQFFPPYHGAPVIRMETLARYPELEGLLGRLAFTLDDDSMQALNARVEEDKEAFEVVAADFLRAQGLLEAARGGESAGASVGTDGGRGGGFFSLIWARRAEALRHTGTHLLLTLAAVVLATLVSVPLGIVCTRRPRLAQGVLGGAGVIQTVPSLALLAFMIPIPGLGLGATSAIVALFLYALLPIVRNTHTGILGVDPALVEAARGMGLTDRQILTKVQLPLAMSTIMAGIRTSTVITVGVATLAAFIGAGGLGEPILTGLQLNEPALIMTGAVPAACLAVAVDQVLGLAERGLTPRGIAPARSAGA
jgi:osmoprotectant transport system permease protein